MKICPSCGSELSDDLSFCPSDGSPLLSEEETPESSVEEGIGEKTVVMSEDAGLGEKTVFMGAEEHEEIETVIPNREDESIGEATVVMPEPPASSFETPPQDAGVSPVEEIPSVPAETMYSAGDAPSATDDTGQWGNEEPVDESEWEEESEETSDTADYAAAADVSEEWNEQEPPAEPESFSVPVSTEPASGSDSGAGEPKKKSKLGLIIALVVLFFTFVFIIVAAGGIWWYLSRSSDTAAANANANENVSENLGDNTTEEPTPGMDDSANTEESPEGTPDDESSSNTNAKPSPSPKTTKSPTPTPTRTPDRTGMSTPTPTRAPTPRPTATPDRSTPAPTPNVPSRVSRGVVNGQAISLPKPAYPSAARAVNAKGTVSVSVIIDRSGNVISARAVSGHPLLRAPAEAAARRARFRPTLLSGQAVEVSGSIVYNFQ
jgi:TonB family protein